MRAAAIYLVVSAFAVIGSILVGDSAQQALGIYLLVQSINTAILFAKDFS